MSANPTPTRRPSCCCRAGYWQNRCVSCGAAARPVNPPRTWRDNHVVRWAPVYLTVLIAAVIGCLLAGEMM